MKIIVAAGGQGTKIWPLSTRKNPKQFQKIIGDESLFTRNINMLLKRHRPEDIFISTKKMYEHLSKEQAQGIPNENYILEPDSPNGRGPAEGFAFLKLSLEYPEEPFSIMQADCLYLPEDQYLDTLEAMEQIVIEEKKLVSGGLVPKFPVLGVDYLLLGENVRSKDGIDIFKVKKFLGRKNDFTETGEVIKKEGAVIHTNLNTWYPNMMLEAYKKHKPGWYEKLMEIKKVLENSGSGEMIEEIYMQMEKGSTEEVTQHVFEEGYIVTYPFKWVDIGTWDSVYQHLSQQGEVYVEGNVVALDSSGTLVKSTKPEKLIAVLGLKDMVVVDTEDVLFIAPRDKVGQVKEIQEELEEKGLEEFL
jgi:mannose-1-phosphate guanylyltransferase